MSTPKESLRNLKLEEVRRLEILSEIGKRINTPKRFSEALRELLDSVVESMEAERGALFLASEESAACPRLALFVDRSEESSSQEFRHSQTVVEKVWTEQTPLAEVDTAQNEMLAGRNSIVAEGIRSVICVPLKGRESTLGVLYLDNRLSAAFTQADLQMLDVISDLAATALERARFFEDLQKLNDDLEQRVVQRTAEATAARVEAELATKAKSLFLAKMSHELRTPLNGILGLTEDLAHREKNPALRLQLSQVVESARSLSTLINGVLDYSKLESEQVAIDCHSFLLEEAVLQSLSTISYQAAKKGLDLQVWIDQSCPLEIEGDSIKLKQILMNLLSNAVKFTAGGWVRLLVNSPRPGWLLFSVADSGIGIPAEKQADIFRPFSQADVSTTREYGGTGLGLSICRSLCQMMGGRLDLESKVGEGSRFSFQLPFRFLKGFEPPDFKGLTMALDISSPARKQALELVLGKWNCKVVGWEQNPQMVITEKIHNSVKCPAIILFHPSAAVDRSIAFRDDQRHLLKPVTRSILLRAIRELIKQKEESGAIRIPEIPNPPTGSVILVAEDHEVNRMVVERMLESWGYQCVFADSGLEAEQLFAERKPRLVLMDIEMPGKDGFETTRIIRSLESQGGARVPIIAVTAHLAADLREKCLASGMDDILPKPLSRKLLGQRLYRWESVLKGQLTWKEARFRDFEELKDWPGKFLSHINSSLSTLHALSHQASTDSIREPLLKFERLVFSAGLFDWGARLVSLPQPTQPEDISRLIEDFRQEWRDLAPSLLPTTA